MSICASVLIENLLRAKVSTPQLIAAIQELDAVSVPFLTREDVGMAGDGVTDDSFVLNRKMKELNAAGLSAAFWLKPQDGKFFYFNSTVDIRSDMWVIFSSARVGPNIVFGPTGRLRMFGSQSELPESNLPKIRQQLPIDTDIIYLGNEPESTAANFSVGGRIVIRGKSDASGIAIEKEEKTIIAVDTINNNLQVDTPFEFTYEVSYPPAEFEQKQGTADLTFVTRLVSNDFAADANPGDMVITLADTSGISIGDWLYLFDDSVAADIGGTSNNFITQEMVQVVDIVGNVLTLNHALYHTYTTAKYARTIRIDVCNNARLTGANMSWNAESDNRDYHAVFVGYATNCLVEDCHCSDAAGFGNKGNGFRLDIGYNNIVDNCSVERPSFLGPGLGYGVAMYGSTNCKATNCYAERCRHSFVYFKGAAGNTFADVTSVGATISDIDFHGANEVYNLVDGFVILGGPIISDDANDKSGIKFGNEFHLAGCSHNFVTNGTIEYPDQVNPSIGVDILPASVGNKVSNLVMKGVSLGIQIIDQSRDTTLKAVDTVLKNIEIHNATDRAMKLQGNANGGSSRVISGLDLINIEMYGCSRHIEIEQAENVTMRGCSTIRPGSTVTYPYMLDARDVTGLRVLHNTPTDIQRAFRVENCPAAVVQDNTFVGLLSSFTPINDISGNTGAVMFPNSPDRGRTVSSASTMKAFDGTVFLSSSSSFTFTLLPAADWANRRMTIKNTGATAQLVDANGSETIESSTLALNLNPMDAVTLFSTGTEILII